jgi:hypothetical protein
MPLRWGLDPKLPLPAPHEEPPPEPIGAVAPTVEPVVGGAWPNRVELEACWLCTAEAQIKHMTNPRRIETGFDLFLKLIESSLPLAENSPPM